MNPTEHITQLRAHLAAHGIEAHLGAYRIALIKHDVEGEIIGRGDDALAAPLNAVEMAVEDGWFV